ncbi:hypothetical protein C8J56DRAFT_1049753 [Mycena floridula]|nr:hypothetical protein C8J56DRAFT_1052384 [Mycena floridula]KAJ7588826.1 hypothetical protein C8J56DRAFT_1049753 [Mycena floridula]
MVALEVTQLIGLCVSILIHGVYLVSFVPCMYSLLWDAHLSRLRHLRKIHWPLVLTTLSIFLASSLTLVLGMYRSISTLKFLIDPNLRTSISQDILNSVDRAKAICMFIIPLASDGILIYRCWIVYYRNYYVIILPALLWIADCAVGLVYIEKILGAVLIVEANSKLKPFMTAYTALTIFLNVITTSMIVLRIWHVDRANAQFRNSSNQQTPTLRNLMRIQIESGLLYTTCTIATFCCYLSGTDAFYIGTDIVRKA